MYLLMIFLPLIGAGFSGFGGRLLGRFGAIILTITCLALSTLFIAIAFVNVGLYGNICVVECFS